MMLFFNLDLCLQYKFLPCGSLNSENSASMAVRGKEGRRSRSSCSSDTCDCLCTAGMCCVREMRKRTRPTSSSLRENTWMVSRCTSFIYINHHNNHLHHLYYHHHHQG